MPRRSRCVLPGNYVVPVRFADLLKSNVRESRTHTRLGCFIDVETTGLNPVTDEIIELAIILFGYDEAVGCILNIVGEYCARQEPTVEMNRFAGKAHGITEKELAGQEIDRAEMMFLADQADFFLAHNARFERTFLRRMFPTFPDEPWYCSMNGLRWIREGFPSRSLARLLEHHKIEHDSLHRAEADARGALTLLCQRHNSGNTYLYELIRRGPIEDEELDEEV